MKRIYKTLFVIVCIVLFCVIFSSCGNSIAKEWICDEIHNGYPDEITIFDDGTGVADNANFTWKTENGKLYINFETKYKDRTFELKTDNGKMYLDSYSYHVRAEGEKPPKITKKFTTVQ